MICGAQLPAGEEWVWGSLVLTMSGARGSGGLAPGEILATGDVLYPNFSVGGEAVGRTGWEELGGPAAQPPARARVRLAVPGLLASALLTASPTTRT